MSVGTDVVAAIIKDIGNGVSKDESDIPMTPEVSEAWDKIEEEMINAEGSVDVPYDGENEDYLSDLLPDED